MVEDGLSAFRNKRVLLLQGPVGPFFSRFAHDLRWAGATVFKVNFNGGDWFFNREGAIAFRGEAKAWPAFYEELLVRLKVDMVMLFGDCRLYHAVAHGIARRRGLEVGVFEEGYLRPHYVTLERHGVNGYSALPSSPIFYLNCSPAPVVETSALGNTFYHAAWWACVYTLTAQLLRPCYPHYRHHRRLSMLEALPWGRALGRKIIYGLLERGVQRRLTTSLSKKYLLVPLQVHDDAQIHAHSDFKSIAQFIEKTVASFARTAPADTCLVIKHHPLDRGHSDYTALLQRLDAKFKLGARMIYVHDLHLPSLLQHARGVVVINSTVGLSALVHGAPLKVCGRSIYNINGLIYQGTLDRFWTDAAKQAPDAKLFARFRDYVIQHTQINGSFYKRLPIPGSFSGMRWEQRPYLNRHAAAPQSTADELAKKSAIS